MSKALRWIGRILGGLVAVLVLAFVVLSIIGSARVNRSYDVQVESIVIPTDAEAVVRGRHIAESMSLCVGCHGESLEGSVLDDDQPIVTIAAPNLTAGEGGVGGSYRDADFVRSIRHGIGPDGRALMIMHSDYYHNLGKQDLAAVIAFIKSTPPVDSDLPRTAPGPIGRAMLPLGVFDAMPIPLFPAEVIDHDAPFAEAPPAGATAEYGEYLVSISLCTMCHGIELSGGPPFEPEMPAAPNIAAHGEQGDWSLQEFIDTIRTGVTPPGRQLDSEAMPWEFYANMTDEELEAIWLYLGSLSGS